MLNPILYAVPVFLLLMAAEYGLARRRTLPVYRAADTVSSLSLGIISQLVGVFGKLLTLGIYSAVYQHAAPWPLPADSAWVWLGALLAYDFLYYWNHRLGHEVALLWAAHVVHHSSEEYNLSTALRQTGTGFLFSWLFYLPMALAGVPPLVFVVVGLVDLLYQFWVHTRLVGKLGWFDRVFVSPSNHRVHHGQNGYCIDRNYGGILILWDRLFGTFVEERDGEPIVYGIRGALRSWNPLRANTHVYAALWRDARLARRWADKLQVFIRHPGWRPGNASAATDAPVDISCFERFAPPLPPLLAGLVLGQLALLLVFALHFLAVAPQLGWVASAIYASAITLQLAALSPLSTQGLAAARWETGRVLAALLLVLASPLHGWAWALLPLAGAVAWRWCLARTARAPGLQPI
jgi:sterol desaturase/sphingolipid hydroxylase (fatty acid hydroxylase superfamily)